MSRRLESHNYVLTRFARLDAPREFIDAEVGLLVEAAGIAPARVAEVTADLHAAIAEYRREKSPLQTEARRLLLVALPYSSYEPTDDPCTIAHRARMEGWPVGDRGAMTRLIELADLCDALDSKLQEHNQQVLSVAL